MNKASHYQSIEAYTTRDGSLIRELMHPTVHGNRQQSLAEATVAAGAETFLHKHTRSEELYHIVQGNGQLTLNNKTMDVHIGDTVCIPPGTAHKIKNTGSTDLKILCCCAPAYSHEDTLLLVTDNGSIE
jgi:mannose-6-phosphate isomerase-like protein (cupin superfamily)